eukprot:6460146-Amphidinium_carterae.4
MTSTVGSLLGVPTTTQLTIGVISVDNTEQQPTPAAEARVSLRLTQAQQHRRRRNTTDTPPRTRRQERLAQQSEQQLEVQEDTVAVVLERRQLTITLPWSFFVSIPLATVRQFVADPVGAMAGNGDFTVINGHMVEEPMNTLQQPRLKASSRAVLDHANNGLEWSRQCG